MPPPLKKKLKMSLGSLSELPLKIVVGKEECTFYVNKALICTLSKFFTAACKKEWTSGQTNTVNLVKNAPETFGIFITWVLTRKLDNAEGLQELMDPKGKVCKEKGFDGIEIRACQLVKCIGLADQLLGHEFHNDVMDELLRITKLCDTFNTYLLSCGSAAALVHENTPLGFKLRNYPIDVWFTLQDSDMEVLIEELKEECPELLVDLFTATHGHLKRGSK